jgi:hypothetical protein
MFLAPKNGLVSAAARPRIDHPPETRGAQAREA